ncbi:MAG: hypothetical protein JW728_03705 [Candidatus Aureabacteria bacterium]|nr:hypothetical protein [Candidatus Auribacterota bacterium]
MADLIGGVKKLSSPMFVIFVVSKILVGAGLGILLVAYLASYGWWFLVTGIVLSLICLILAIKKV